MCYCWYRRRKWKYATCTIEANISTDKLSCINNCNEAGDNTGLCKTCKDEYTLSNDKITCIKASGSDNEWGSGSDNGSGSGDMVKMIVDLDYVFLWLFWFWSSYFKVKW